MLLTDELKNNDNPVVVLGGFNDGHQSNTLHGVIRAEFKYRPYLGHAQAKLSAESIL
jgi:hypothetical protein